METETLVVVDTDVLIEFIKGVPEAVATFAKIGHDNVALTVFTLMEVYVGCLNKQEFLKIARILDRFGVLYARDDEQRQALDWVKTYCLSHDIDLPDVLNAAMSVRQGLPICTKNRKDYRYLPGVILYPYGR